ncbi:hypothetical protein ACH5RR_012442 [Cinchona calisaya]|uniref:Uncharacterized protein n=1 Tax=Cinchona calisaya TaxID=153742 RepID=A0ABD3AA58_9GENT
MNEAFKPNPNFKSLGVHMSSRVHEPSRHSYPLEIGAVEPSDTASNIDPSDSQDALDSCLENCLQSNPVESKALTSIANSFELLKGIDLDLAPERPLIATYGMSIFKSFSRTLKAKVSDIISNGEWKWPEEKRNAYVEDLLLSLPAGCLSYPEGKDHVVWLGDSSGSILKISHEAVP